MNQTLEYESDTLTSAHRNRAASKKIFQQWIISTKEQASKSSIQMTLQPPATTSSSCEPPVVMHSNNPTEQQPHLHRSPSGAQKKIRQRKDEKLQQSLVKSQQHSRLNSSSFSSTSSLSGGSTNIPALGPQLNIENTSSSLIDYRSLVDLESYRSILPEDSISGITMGRDNEFAGIRFKDGLEKPIRPPRNSDFSKSKIPAWEEEDNSGSALSSSDAYSNFPTLNNEHIHPGSTTNGYFGKPTVQVHPMPAMKTGSLSSSHISPPETLKLKKLPPPIPKKPNQISKRVIATNDSFSETEADISECPSPALFWTSKTAKSPITLSTPITSQLHKGNGSFEKSMPFTSTSSIINSFSDVHSSSIGQSTESLSMLCNSPSLLSLQNSLNHALSNPEQHTQEQLQELEKRRQQSMESLSKKAYERRLDREAVCEELEQVDQIRVTIFKTLSSGTNFNDSILSRLNVHIIQGERLVELETRLHIQLEKLESAANNFEHNSKFDNDALTQRKHRLAQQLDDALVIRSSYNCRDEQLDDELSHLVPNSLFQEWRFYKSTMLKLIAEKKQIDEKLKNVKTQLEALQSMVTAFKPIDSQTEKSQFQA